jgi:hypothetical protein
MSFDCEGIGHPIHARHINATIRGRRQRGFDEFASFNKRRFINKEYGCSSTSADLVSCFPRNRALSLLKRDSHVSAAVIRTPSTTKFDGEVGKERSGLEEQRIGIALVVEQGLFPTTYPYGEPIMEQAQRATEGHRDIRRTDVPRFFTEAWLACLPSFHDPIDEFDLTREQQEGDVRLDPPLGISGVVRYAKIGYELSRVVPIVKFDGWERFRVRP